jgi:hypothetical protein
MFRFRNDLSSLQGTAVLDSADRLRHGYSENCRGMAFEHHMNLSPGMAIACKALRLFGPLVLRRLGDIVTFFGTIRLHSGSEHMRRLRFVLFNALVSCADAGPVFCQDETRHSGAPVPTKPFPLFHNPTDQFGPPVVPNRNYVVLPSRQHQPPQRPLSGTPPAR